MSLFIKSFFVTLVLLFLTFSSSVLFAEANLLSNSGFEEGGAGWELNNWDKLPATYTFVEDDVHSGEKALRMELEENTNGTNIQLYQTIGGKLTQAESVRLSFWIKGTDNAAPVDVAIAQNQSPWTDYVLQPIVVDDSWRRHEIFWTPGNNVDFETLRVNFYVRDEMVVLLDDVELSIIDSEMGGEPYLGNLLPNASFELGRDRWYFSVQPFGAWERAPVENIGWVAYDSLEKPFVAETEDAKDGIRALKLVVGEHMAGQVSSAYFKMRYGHPVQVSFDVKSNEKAVNGQLTVSTAGDFSTRLVESTYFQTKPSEWKTVSMEMTPRPSTNGVYTIEVLFYNPGTFWIDNFVVNEIEAGVDPKYPEPQIGWIKPDAKLGHIYSIDDRLSLPLIGTPSEAETNLEGYYEVIDVYQNVVNQGPFELFQGSNGFFNGEARLPTNQYGAFKAVFYLNSTSPGDTPDLEWQYLILPDLPRLGSVKDYFFSGHARLTEESLEVAEKVGIRSIRLHPPLSTKWRTLEVAPGEWNFENPRIGLKRAKEKGFDIMGSLDTTPDFHAGLPNPRPQKTWMGYGNYPPKDLSLWKDYVSKTVEAFDDLIDVWEVWNEPDNHFLEGPSFPELQGETKEDLYKNLVKYSREAIEEGGFDKTLIGGAVARLESPVTRYILDNDTSEHADVFSFHVYGGTINRERLRLIREAQAEAGRDGSPVEVWHTEGAYFPSMITWLEAPGIPKAKPELAGKMTDYTVIRMVEMKAYRVKRNYHYPAPYENRTGRHIYRNEFTCGHDTAGNPLPIWAAHAACVKFLEGAEPVGDGVFTQKINGSVVKVAKFLRDGQLIDVLWSEDEVPFDRVEIMKGEGIGIFDIMGNPMKVSDIETVNSRPIYFMSELN